MANNTKTPKLVIIYTTILTIAVVILSALYSDSINYSKQVVHINGQMIKEIALQRDLVEKLKQTQELTQKGNEAFCEKLVQITDTILIEYRQSTPKQALINTINQEAVTRKNQTPIEAYTFLSIVVEYVYSGDVTTVTKEIELIDFTEAYCKQIVAPKQSPRLQPNRPFKL